MIPTTLKKCCLLRASWVRLVLVLGIGNFAVLAGTALPNSVTLVNESGQDAFVCQVGLRFGLSSLLPLNYFIF